MSETRHRYDVSYGKDGISLDFHFCREITYDNQGNEIGCFGVDPDHGLPFDNAKEEAAQYHEREAAYWRQITEEQWLEDKDNAADPDLSTKD